jgi:undecaprenyl phosphate-alpha-L-ara4FN deformylase
VACIALKVDVDTLRGTRDGVPRLLGAFDRAAVRATFLFSLGPDHTGWALRRVLRSGFVAKVARTSVVRHYGLRTLMYGVLLPAPDIGRVAAAPMQATRDAGHECGIHCWDHVVWQDHVRGREGEWTRHQMRLAFERFGDVFGAAPATHGAAGWQMNDDAFRQIDAWGLAYASDVRGPAPFVPSVAGVPFGHVQLPTTLPTLDELIGVDGIDESNVVASLLARTEGARDHVYTLHAELEGGLFLPAFERLLAGWRAQGHRVGSLSSLYAGIDRTTLPVLPVSWGTVPGRSGDVVYAASPI